MSDDTEQPGLFPLARDELAHARAFAALQIELRRDEWRSTTQAFRIAGVGFHLIVKERQDNGLPFGIDFRVEVTEDPTLQAWGYQWAIAVNHALAAGADPELLFRSFRGQRFAPDGFTSDPEIPRVSSPVDYVARWVTARYFPCKDGCE